MINGTYGDGKLVEVGISSMEPNPNIGVLSRYREGASGSPSVGVGEKGGEVVKVVPLLSMGI